MPEPTLSPATPPATPAAASTASATGVPRPDEDVTTTLYRAAIGPVNPDFYLPIFARFEAADRAGLSWNTAAGLLTSTGWSTASFGGLRWDTPGSYCRWYCWCLVSGAWCFSCPTT